MRPARSASRLPGRLVARRTADEVRDAHKSMQLASSHVPKPVSLCQLDLARVCRARWMASVLPRFGPFGPLPPPHDEFGIKETRPRLAGGRAGGYDLVERMEYLYVRVVKARDLRWGGGDLDPFAEVKLGATPARRGTSRRRRAPSGTTCSPSRGSGSRRRSWTWWSGAGASPRMTTSGTAASTWATPPCAWPPTARSRRSGTTSSTARASAQGR